MNRKGKKETRKKEDSKTRWRRCDGRILLRSYHSKEIRRFVLYGCEFSRLYLSSMWQRDSTGVSGVLGGDFIVGKSQFPLYTLYTQCRYSIYIYIYGIYIVYIVYTVYIGAAAPGRHHLWGGVGWEAKRSFSGGREKQNI